MFFVSLSALDIGFYLILIWVWTSNLFLLSRPGSYSYSLLTFFSVLFYHSLNSLLYFYFYASYFYISYDDFCNGLDLTIGS